MALSQRTPPHIEEAVIERHRMGMTIASIEKEVPVSNNTIRRITQGLARDQIDETLCLRIDFGSNQTGFTGMSKVWWVKRGWLNIS